MWVRARLSSDWGGGGDPSMATCRELHDSSCFPSVVGSTYGRTWPWLRGPRAQPAACSDRLNAVVMDRAVIGPLPVGALPSCGRHGYSRSQGCRGQSRRIVKDVSDEMLAGNPKVLLSIRSPARPRKPASEGTAPELGDRGRTATVIVLGKKRSIATYRAPARAVAPRASRLAPRRPPYPPPLARRIRVRSRAAILRPVSWTNTIVGHHPVARRAKVCPIT